MRGQIQGCKGCTESVRVTPEKLERLIEIAIQGREVGTKEEVEQRLRQCSSCPGLQYGTTCQYCGCLVAVRAQLLKSECPHPSASRWDRQNIG